MSIHARIKLAMELRAIDERRLAAMLDITPAAVYQWVKEGGTAPRRMRLTQVANALRVREEWLINGTGQMESEGVLQRVNQGLETQITFSGADIDTQTVQIPQYATGGAMGHGLILRDQPGIIKGWTVNQEWLQKNARNYTAAKNLAIVTGFGDSMRPIYQPGDPLLVDTGIASVDFDGIYFFRVGDEGFVKRLQRIPGEGIVAISENKAYRDWTIKADMDFQVFGRVIKAWCGQEY